MTTERIERVRFLDDNDDWDSDACDEESESSRAKREAVTHQRAVSTSERDTSVGGAGGFSWCTLSRPRIDPTPPRANAQACSRLRTETAEAGVYSTQ
ncbi:hypothetical protein E2C01_004371 [Portunus trituberculatus]|uniref:Uncharacterized protein n=1 Tax=Portunus trituberculatus TaxID=210409 RepID=A0A5B7CQD7_PORTR|nr:hypothetical protein [Portunus trituberculatus]